MKESNFIGVKVALINNEKVLTILRDDISTIPFPNMWDLAGGGRENQESPYETMSREVMEELNIYIPESDVIWIKSYESMTNSGNTSIFMVANMSDNQLNHIQFGDEGQTYRMVSFNDFIDNKDVIEQLRNHFIDYLNS